MKSFLSVLQKYLLYIAWVQALIGTLFSLYFSEVLQWVPCVLCWYQRILLYPLVIILAVGILKKDKGVSGYVLPFSIGGMLIAFYQILLEHGIISEAAAPCSFGVSCTTAYIRYFGFITIPFLSFAAFGIITGSMIVYRRSKEKKQYHE